jgi:hypothetical protein
VQHIVVVEFEGFGREAYTHAVGFTQISVDDELHDHEYIKATDHDLAAPAAAIGRVGHPLLHRRRDLGDPY